MGKFLLMAIQYIQFHFLAKYGQTRTSFATTSMGLWLSAIADDIGVGLIHNIVFADHSLIREQFEQVAIIPIREKMALEVGLLVPRNDDEATHVFATFIQKYFEELIL